MMSVLRPKMGTRRGFTLLELLAGITVGGLVISAALQVFLTASVIAAESRVRAQLANEAGFAATLMSQEMRMAGLGVPTGTDQATNTTALKPYASTLLANTTEFGFVGDLPQPSAQYITMGNLDDAPGGSQANNAGIMYHNENNGSCAPKTSASDCSTATTSIFFPGATAQLCDSTGSTADRTCPWGLKRLQGGDPFLIVDGVGRWFQATNNASLTLQSNTLTTAPNVTNILMLNIGTAGYNTGVWGGTTAADAPSGGFRVGYVSTPDRVFYKYDSGTKTLQRAQCWGGFEPNHANWPQATSAALPAAPCTLVSSSTGLAFEKILGNVESFAFSYYTDAGATVAGGAATANAKKSIARVEYSMKLSRKVFKKNVQHQSVGGVLMRMRLL